MKIKVILFDLGNVVIPVAVDNTIQYWSRISGIPRETIHEKMNFDKDHEASFFSFERGEISPRKFRKIVSSILGYRFSKKDFDHGWNLMIENVRPGTEDLLEALSGKYRLAALSNTNIIHERHFIKRFPRVFSRFDRLFLSHRIGGRKPDEAVFRKVLGFFNVLPGETVFLDDREDFIEAAKKMGIRAIHVSSGTDIADSLKKAGVEL